MKPADSRLLPLLGAELAGTALLVAVGVSLVVLDFAPDNPVIAWLPDPALRRALTGLLFGTVGACITLSPLGKASGAHLNPAVTLAFWLEGRMKAGLALAYAAAQLAGGVIGGFGLRAWGGRGASVSFGATLPGPAGPWAALGGEVATTFVMITLLLVFLGHRRLRRFTPGLFPPLYALLVWLEAPLSGTSTNPARSLGPALAAHDLRGLWIDFAGPALGTAAAVVLHRTSALRVLVVEVAKVFHFGHDPHGIFARQAKGGA